MPESTTSKSSTQSERAVLHVGCGPANPKKLHKTFHAPGWREVRYDIDPKVKPDIVGSITRMSAIPTGSFDAVWSSHNLEHLYVHEVPLALKEFHRILKPGGFALITLPDLQKVAELVAADKLEEIAYQSPAGPVRPLDMIYGWRGAISKGNLFMAHHTGFTAKTLAASLQQAGFATIDVKRDGFNLWAHAIKKPRQSTAAAGRVQ